jgi:hypothetical protein
MRCNLNVCRSQYSTRHLAESSSPCLETGNATREQAAKYTSCTTGVHERRGCNFSLHLGSHPTALVTYRSGDLKMRDWTAHLILLNRALMA